MNKVAHGFKIGAGMMTAAMSLTFMGGIPVLAQVDTELTLSRKDWSNTLLGTSGMADPVIPENRNDDWEGSYVYFGNEEGYPIKFRVLDTDTTDYGSRTMLLDCDECLFKMNFDSYGSNVWDTSDLKIYLNNAFRYDDFTYNERQALAFSKKNGGTSYEKDSFEAFFYGKTVGLEGDYVFVLDASELLNEDYGYFNHSGWELYGDKWDEYTYEIFNFDTWGAYNHCKCIMDTDDYANWWLRSAFPRESDMAVYANSSCYVTDADDSHVYVSPALNVKKDAIIFSTAIDGAPGETGTEYKLTLATDSIKVTIPSDKDVVLQGRTVTIPYTLSGSDSDNVDRVTVLITDKSYQYGNANDAKILYYDELDCGSGADQGTFTLPTGLNVSDWGKKYYVYIVAENTNRTYETDIASLPYPVQGPEVQNQTGWVRAGEDWYYYDKDGNAVSGWNKINGSWYYFENDGLMYVGWLNDGGTEYYLMEDGKMATGWKAIGKTYYFADIWYYFGSNGAMRTGWQQISGKWYYFDSDGSMHVGFLDDGGKTYFFDEDEGAMKTGWMGIEGTYIYFDASGAAVKNCWKEINGKWYYFDDSGLMASAEWRGGYWLNADGSWTYPYKASWKHDSTGWWYGDTSGWYAKNSTEKIDGIEYDFDAEGYWIS